MAHGFAVLAHVAKSIGSILYLGGSAIRLTCSLHQSWAALITTSPRTSFLIDHCLTQDFPGFGSSNYYLSQPEIPAQHRLRHLHHSTSRALIIAGLSGFFTLSQSRDGPDR
jgi:hypothetical protein